MSAAQILDSAKFAWTMLAILAIGIMLRAVADGHLLGIIGAVALLCGAVSACARLPASPPPETKAVTE